VKYKGKITSRECTFILLLISERTKLSDTLNRHNSLKVNYLFKLKLTLKLVLPLTE